MREYRIIEMNNNFYSQEKRWLWWEFLDNAIPHFTWNGYKDYHAMCDSKAHAEMVIKKRIKYLQRSKKIIHEFKPQDNA